MTIDETEWSALVARIVTLEDRVRELEEKKKPKKAPTGVSEVRDTFLKSFESFHGHPYAGWSAKENAQAAMLIRAVSLEKAIQYAKIYPTWLNQFAVKSGHPFGLLLKSYVELESDLKRRAAKLAMMAEGKIKDKMEMEEAQKEREVHARAIQARHHEGSRQVGHAVVGQIPHAPDSKLPGPGDRPHLTVCRETAVPPTEG